MFEKVLIATDISSGSLAILEFMGQLKRIGTREFFLVQCIQSKEALYGAAENEEMLKSALEKKKDVLEKQGFTTTALVVVGNILNEINRIVEENGCSMIVVGVMRTSLVKEMFFSDITNFIAKNTAGPVLILPMKREEKGNTACLQCEKWDIKRHILFPTDFSLNADLAFSCLREIVKTGVEKVTLLHVQDREKIADGHESRLESFNEIDKQRLEDLKSNLKGAKQIEISIPYGFPVEEIMKAVEAGKVSQVIMGSQGRGYIQEIFMGGVSHKIARTSGIPVMLVPFKESAAA